MTSLCSVAYTGFKKNSQALTAAQIVLSSLFILLCSEISISLPFTPVPLSLQTFAVMIVGAKLGSRNGAGSVVLYLMECFLDPSTMMDGELGLLALIGPTGGYLIGFVFQAYLVGWFAERKQVLGKSRVMLGIFLSCALQLTFGAIWLGQFVGFSHMIMMGIIPFIPGEILKALFVVNYLIRNDNNGNQ